MSMWGDRGHCPKCGRFCGSISAQLSPDFGISAVRGKCSVHGTVDLTGQAWSYEDFDSARGSA
jgi:hypothetical protein